MPTRLYAYVDESKKLSEGKAIFAAYVSRNNVHTTNVRVEELKARVGISWELKFKRGGTGENFVEYLSANGLEKEFFGSMFGVSLAGYDDSEQTHFLSVLELFQSNIELFSEFDEVRVILDRVTMRDCRDTEKRLSRYLTNNLGVRTKFFAEFTYSKKCGGVQLADIAAGILRRKYFFDPNDQIGLQIKSSESDLNHKINPVVTASSSTAFASYSPRHLRDLMKSYPISFLRQAFFL